MTQNITGKVKTRNKNIGNKQKRNNGIVNLNANISIITLNVQDLNTIKSQRLSDLL